MARELTERVRKAIASTKRCLPDYWEATLAQRSLLSGRAVGSVYQGMTPDQIESMVLAAEWEPYGNPAVMTGCTAAIASLPGRLGLTRLDELPNDKPVYLLDPKKTGKCSAVIAGILGPWVPFSVLILGMEKLEDGSEEQEEEIVFTFHPGDPVRASELPVEGNAGRVSVAEAIALGFELGKVDHQFPKHTHSHCLACDARDFTCWLEVCYEIGVVGQPRECPGCVEYYRRANDDFQGNV